MPFEESLERLTSKRWNEATRMRGRRREENAGVREGVRQDIRANGRFDDQTGVALGDLLMSSGSWGGE
jgi:hypothetical protein